MTKKTDASDIMAMMAGGTTAPKPKSKQQSLVEKDQRKDAGGPMVVSKGLGQLAKGGRTVRRSKPGRSGIVSVILMGEKDAGKSVSPANIPVPKLADGTDARRVYITFDETTEESLYNYYGPWAEENVEVINMVLPDREIGYEGFDPSKPNTSKEVLGQFFLILEELEREGNVGLLVIDHFQYLYEGIAKAFAYATNGVNPLTANLEFQQWNPRTNSMTQLNHKIRRAVMRGGYVFATGYAPNEKSVMKKDPKTGKMRIVTEVKAPTWLKDDIKRDWLVQMIARTTTTDTDPGSTDTRQKDVRYQVEVLTSKTRIFPKGKVVDVTGVPFFNDAGDPPDPKGLSVFFHEDELLGLTMDEQAPVMEDDPDAGETVQVIDGAPEQ